MKGWSRGLAAALATGLAASPAGAVPLSYDLTTRTANLESPLLPPPGELSLYYTHRFSGGLTAIGNAPTFILGTSVLPWLGLDLVYATKATLVSPASAPVLGAHEVGLTVREELLRESSGAPVSLALTEGVFSAGIAPDPKGAGGLSANALGGRAGLTLGRTFGRLGLVGAVRAVGLTQAVVGNVVYPSDVNGLFGRVSAGLGATFAVTPNLSLAADWAKYFDGPLEVPAWSAGIQGEIPFTPHLITFEVTNVPTLTLGGAAQPAGDLFFGMGFGIRFRGLDRWTAMVLPPQPAEPGVSEGEAPLVGEAATVSPPAGPPGPAPGEVIASPTVPEMAAAPVAAPPRAPAPAVVVMKDYVYIPATVTVRPGTTVYWVDRDPVAHTATATNRKWDTGSIEENASLSIRFDRPGVYPYICAPHPFMKGTVIVKEEAGNAPH